MLSHRPPALSTQHAALRVARLISIAAHPLVLSPLTVALASRDLRWAATVAAWTMLPIVAVILWNVRRGVWSDFDVSRREQRSGLYWYAIPLLLGAYLFLPAQPEFRRSMLALIAVLLVAFALSRFQKTSLHLMFAAFCTVVLWQVYPWSLFAMVIVLAALAWSRWYLRHHTPLELVTGTLLGLAAGIYTIS